MLRNKRALLLLAAAAVLLTACRQKEKEIQQSVMEPDLVVKEESTFNTTTVTRGRYVDTEAFKGTVVYFNSIELSFPEENAAFLRFLVKAGDKVSEGDKIAECTVNIPEMKLKEYRIKLNALKEELKEKTEIYENVTAELKLNSQNSGSEEEKQLYELLLKKKRFIFNRSRTELQNGEAELIKTIETTQNDMNSNIVCAPMSGIIDKLAYLNEGDKVEKDRWVAIMHSEDESYIQVTDGNGLLYQNMTVRVEAGPASGKVSYEGTVVQADNVLGGSLRTGTAYIKLNDESIDLGLLENILVYADTSVADDVLLVKRSAVYTANGKKYVILLENGTAKKRYVTVGLNNSDYYCILDGASEGWEVIVQ